MSGQGPKVPGCKVVLLGDSGVGKTCIISRYISGTFEANSASTNGASYASKIVKYEKLGKTLSLDIWDTAGQEKYKALTKFFYKDAAVAILVYDITRKESFDSLKNYWYNQLQENGGKSIVLGVAGNKCDMYEQEAVPENEAREFAKSINAIYSLTSAQNNTGINELFMDAGNKYLDPNFQQQINDGNEDVNQDKLKLEHDKGKEGKKSQKKCC